MTKHGNDTHETHEMKTILPFSRPFACFVGNARVADHYCGMIRMGTSDLDFDSMPKDRKRVVNSLPAMLYHGLPRRSGPAKPGLPRRSGLAKTGLPRRSSPAKPGVNTEAGVLMRMNAVPRSIATGLGEKFAAMAKEGAERHSVRSARSYLRNLSPSDWQRSAPSNAKMSGEDYRDIWSLLAGEHFGQRSGVK